MEVRFGKFILTEKLAEGGMGEVFLARQRGLGQFERVVVLKRLRRDLTADDRFETLFLEEARISARLSHPNVVQVYEFGHIDDSYFLTLEYVRGAKITKVSPIVKLCVTRSMPPLAVPPLSWSWTVIVEDPNVLAAGVYVNVPLLATAGPAENNDGFVLPLMLNVNVWPASSVGPALIPVAQFGTVCAPLFSRTV